MGEEVRLWSISSGNDLRELPRSPLNFEERIEEWLTRDISIVDPGLLVIGRQVETAFGGIIDLLCLDSTGDVVVVELKRDKTPREITAQVLDYGSWVKDLSNDQITSLAEGYLGPGAFGDAFKRRFFVDIPEILGENHRLLIVASEIDTSSERIIKYLSETYGVNINAATFQYFKDGDDSEFLARVFLLNPTQVELQSRTKGSSKRQPNLTYDELDTLAQENGVGDLYQSAVRGFELFLQKHTTRSSIGFTATLDGSRKTVVTLMPQGSNTTDGLRYRAYSRRLRALLHLPDEEELGFLPLRREPWIYHETASPEYEGFEGFISSEAEVARFVSGFESLKKAGIT